MQKIVLVAGARPNFMKIAPILREMEQTQRECLQPVLVHTGQHYDELMSGAFFPELGIRPPDHHLGGGSGSHASQTARVMLALEGVLLKERPDTVVVVGDVDSTLAGAVTAKKLGMRLAHVEAGLRSRDRTMPEEVNRVLTDAVSDMLFATEPSGVENLLAEGRPRDAIYLAGNVMIDTLFYELDRLDSLAFSMKPPARPFAVLTLHRPANVDNRARFGELMKAIEEISRSLPMYFPVHPRTKLRLKEWGLLPESGRGNVHYLPPMGYREFLRMWKEADLVLTDSGGLQEETTALSIPCFTIRENTERPVTVTQGTNTLVGVTGEGLLQAFAKFQKEGPKKGSAPELWDGHAARRIVAVLAENR